MWTGLLWFVLLAAAGLTYPRRPRTSGMLWIVLGTLSLVMNIQRNGGSSLSLAMTVQRNGDSWLGPISGLFMISMGTWYLIKYRNPDVRAKHVKYWTAKT